MADSILFPPTLSSSSINITHGALVLASSVRKNSKGAILLTAEALWAIQDCFSLKGLLKRFLMRLAPTPTNISSNSDPEA